MKKIITLLLSLLSISCAKDTDRASSLPQTVQQHPVINPEIPKTSTPVTTPEKPKTPTPVKTEPLKTEETDLEITMGVENILEKADQAQAIGFFKKNKSDLLTIGRLFKGSYSGIKNKANYLSNYESILNQLTPKEIAEYVAKDVFPLRYGEPDLSHLMKTLKGPNLESFIFAYIDKNIWPKDTCTEVKPFNLSDEFLEQLAPIPQDFARRVHAHMVKQILKKADECLEQEKLSPNTFVERILLQAMNRLVGLIGNKPYEIAQKKFIAYVLLLSLTHEGAKEPSEERYLNAMLNTPQDHDKLRFISLLGHALHRFATEKEKDFLQKWSNGKKIKNHVVDLSKDPNLD